jgi:hypothetical protein
VTRNSRHAAFPARPNQFGFWYNAALTLVGRAVVGGALLAVVSAGVLYLMRPRGTTERRVPAGPVVAAAE